VQVLQPPRDIHQVAVIQGGVSNLNADATAGLEGLVCWANSTWWTWPRGSTLLFWRWDIHNRIARDGMLPFISGTLPNHTRAARRPKQLKVPLYIPKLKSIIERGYVSTGHVCSLADYFDVPKADDIRLVYNGTSCGLNEALWAPNFWLPTPRSALRVLGYNYYSVDQDLSDMFLSFPLHPKLQPYSGIDLTPFKQELNIKSTGPYWLRWTRCWMGAKPSPYCAVAFYYYAEEFVRGNRTCPNNPLRWHQVKLNLPGDPKFDPTLPRVMKWDNILQTIAGDMIAFVDDLRASGATLEQAWMIARLIASRLQYLGIPEATRKRRPPTKSPGAWAGAVFHTSSTSVRKTVAPEKWEKAKRLINELDQALSNPDPNHLINYKELERTRGFLNHLAMTYESLVHHLKGFHLTLASHNSHRDLEGWKLNDKDWELFLDSQLEDEDVTHEQIQVMRDVSIPINAPPMFVRPLPHLRDDVHALKEILSSQTPPEIEDRRKDICFLMYGFADASGSGLGSSIMLPDARTRIRIGIWGKDIDNESSNFREFSNVVLCCEEEAKQGTLNGSHLFLFTDNSTVESALYKGNSPSRKLFNLIVRLRKVELECSASITVSHVSGKRMIAQGTDGISRGEMNQGVGRGESMLSFIPLHLSALDRQPSLVSWVKSWLGTESEFLTPEDWFGRGHLHDGGRYDHKGFWRPTIRSGRLVWSPPPAAADVALEELRKSVLKRQTATHVFLCPRLLTPEWRRQLHKVADIVLYLPTGGQAWCADQFEPLTIGIVFPYLHCRPWQLRGTPKLLSLGRSLQTMLSKEDLDAGDLLHKLCRQCWSFRAMPGSVVRRVLYFEPNGDVPREDIGGE
jgi:hypothetical protein